MATHSRNRCVVWNSRRESHLGSGHVRPRQQTGHMIASDLIRAAAKTLASRGPSTYGSRKNSTQPTASAAMPWRNLGPPACPAPSKPIYPSPPLQGIRARSSAGEHYVDIVGVTGSIPVAPTSLRLLRKLRLGKPAQGCRADLSAVALAKAEARRAKAGCRAFRNLKPPPHAHPAHRGRPLP